MADAVIVPERHRWMRIAAAIARDQLFDDQGAFWTERRLDWPLTEIVNWHARFEKYRPMLDPRVVFSNFLPDHNVVIVAEMPDNIIPFPLGRVS